MEIVYKTVLWTYREITESERNFIVGEHEVRVRVTQDRDPKYISIGYSSSKENWDAKHGLPLPSHPKFLELSTRIKKML